MDLEVQYNIMLAEPGATRIRYLQVGIDSGEGFTGLVQDFVGGGEGVYYFVDGESPDDGEMDDDEQEEILEERYPGVMEAIGAFLEEHTRFDDATSQTHARPHLFARFSDRDGEVLGTYPEPYEVGLTGFP